MSSRHRLVDYFVISGLDVDSGLEPDQIAGESLHCAPLDRPFKSHVLAHYPDEVPGTPFDASATCMLQFPKGVRFQTQKDAHQANFHTFLITREDGSKSFGAAFSFFEEVKKKQIMSAMQTLQAMHLAELSNAQSRTLYSHLGPVYKHSPRLQKRPDSKPTGRIYDMRQDKLFVTKSIAVISQLPLVSVFEQIMRLLHAAVVHPEEVDLPLECYIYNMIFEIPLLPPGRSMKFSCMGQTLYCQRPGLSELPLLDYPLQQMFKLLGVENIISLFSSILLEHQVLLLSTDHQRLMLVAEGITSLMFPFQWQHVYVPILPASLLHFLDAPVPFIMGLHHIDNVDLRNELCSKANLCFVDIDKGIVELPEDLPLFPYHNRLIEDLEQRLRIVARSREQYNGHNRDSGFRDSYTQFEEGGGSSSTDVSASSSLWSIPNKMEVLQQSEALAKITALAKKTGVISSLDDISDSLNDEIFKTRSNVKAPLADHVKDLIFNSSIREIFLHYFLRIFNAYEAFVDMPRDEDMEAWLNNRETMQNFDKAAFLGDQPEAHLPFLSAFLESQSFTTFIDNKIIAKWEDPDRHLSVFEARLRTFRDDQGDQRLQKYHKTSSVQNAETIIERRAQSVDLAAPTPRMQEGCQQHRQAGVFPILSSQTLGKEPSSNNRSRRDGTRWRKKDRLQQQTEHLQLSSDQKELKHASFKSWPFAPSCDPAKALSYVKYIQEARSKNLRQPKLSDLNPSAMAQTNWKFVETLLKECKAKTKRMLVQKMGQEAVELGHGEATLSGVEENTLIASLCDLLERIWSHGVQSKQGKSALWSHLLKFQEVQCSPQMKTAGGEVNPSNPNLLNPDLSNASLEADMPCPSGTQTWPIRRHRRKPSRGPEMPVLTPMPVSVTFDMKNVQQMSDIKTEVGYSRAWVRLSLEKKVLSRHLKELLSKPTLLRSLYKRYAFLRCTDEIEQFLYHMLSLNAVDYYCFTNTFTSTVIPYRLLIFPRQKLSGATTTANCWLCLAGHLGDTGKVPIPKHTLDFSVEHRNLGVLSTLRLGHDNAGMSPKWMVEHVLARNEITGQTYRFPCGRWLGKGADDGSLERLLVAEIVPPSTDHSELMEKCRTPPRCRSPSMPRRSSEPKLQVSEIQEMLGDAVNNLVKHFYKPEKERGSVTGLLCGEYGLVFCMEHVFQCGFKSARLFRNRFFVWDFLEKVQVYFETLLADTEHFVIAEDLRQTMTTYCQVLAAINSSEAIGKDGKFQLFICIGVRDRLLQRWIRIISKTPVTANMYEERSFLRDPTLVQFLTQILDSLKDFVIKLEASLTKGVHL